MTASLVRLRHVNSALNIVAGLTINENVGSGAVVGNVNTVESMIMTDPGHLYQTFAIDA